MVKKDNFSEEQLYLVAVVAGRPQTGPAPLSLPHLSSAQAEPLSPSLATTKPFTLDSAVKTEGCTERIKTFLKRPDICTE